MNIITRFPPSPTGFLHIGGLRTALFNYLYAKHSNGKIVLRIEDTDSERSEKRFSDMISEACKWVGLSFDKGPYFQSQRVDIYKKYVDKLLDEGKAYKCYCTKERLKKLRDNQIATGDRPHYDCHCRTMDDKDESYTIRLRLPDGLDAVEFKDMIHGNISVKLSELDDFIIVRSNGMPMYNLACVIDDALMGITDIIRGNDHISNTPKQILIYKALGLTVPRFAHVPMILGPDKKRFSKRHGATSVGIYKDEGYLPDALLNYIVRLGFAYEDKEIFSVDEMIRYFDIEHVGKSAAIFDKEKLLWLNAVYIRDREPEKLAEEVIPFVNKLTEKRIVNDERLVKMVKTVQPRAKTLKEMASQMMFYFEAPDIYDAKGLKKYCKGEIFSILSEIISLMRQAEWSEESLKNIINSMVEKYQLKLIKIAQPVRIALTGKTVSPGVYEMLMVLGKDVSIKRLEQFCGFLNRLPNPASYEAAS